MKILVTGARGFVGRNLCSQLNNIKEGKEVQSSAQRPTYMGYQAVVTALKILNGEEVEFKTLIPSYSITADNIDEFDLDAWDSIEE